MKNQFFYLAVALATVGLSAKAATNGLIQSTDEYMGKKPARIAEIHAMCAKYAEASKGNSDQKQLLLGVCAFDTSHTTGFNAVTQAHGKVADLTKVQTSDYTMSLIGSISSEIKKCQAKRDRSLGADEDLYCVAMRGYAVGKLYGQRYLDGKKM